MVLKKRRILILICSILMMYRMIVVHQTIHQTKRNPFSGPSVIECSCLRCTMQPFLYLMGSA